MNRRDLFRFAGLASAAAVVPAIALSTENERYLVFHTYAGNTKCEGFAKRFDAIWSAYKKSNQTKREVMVFGNADEGLIFSLPDNPNWRTLPAIL